MLRILPILLICLLVATGCKQTDKGTAETIVEEENWEPLFNQKDLTGWTVKIAGYPVGENFGNTFRVEDGLLRVSYDAYEGKFDNSFGHIFTDKDYANYKLRIEYRFYGQPLDDTPGWAYLNSGAMLHAQSPESMELDQSFPVSIEAQFLSCDEKSGERTTGNVCTPGTVVSVDGVVQEDHCSGSGSRPYNADEWITMEMIVYGDSLVHHIIEGDTILTYTDLEIDGKGMELPDGLQPGRLKSGRIAVQSEGHPVEFRKIEILELK